MNVFKKLKYYKFYKKIIKDNKDMLNRKYNLRIDDAYRLYTVLNMPTDVEAYGSKLTEKYLTEYISKVDTALMELGLNELIGIGEMKKIDEINYLIIFRFSLMDTAKYLRKKYIIIITTILISLISLFIIF